MCRWAWQSKQMSELSSTLPLSCWHSHLLTQTPVRQSEWWIPIRHHVTSPTDRGHHHSTDHRGFKEGGWRWCGVFTYLLSIWSIVPPLPTHTPSSPPCFRLLLLARRQRSNKRLISQDSQPRWFTDFVESNIIDRQANKYRCFYTILLLKPPQQRFQ